MQEDYVMRSLILLMLFFGAAKVYADNVMRFTTSTHANAFPEIIELFTKAYSNIGYKIELIELPDRRSLYEAKNRSWVDGELARVKGAALLLPNHIRVPVPVKRVDISVYVKNINFDVNGWNSLLPYKIGALRGILAIENKLIGFNVSEAGSPLQLLQMLNRGRVQIAVIPRPMGEQALEAKDYNIRVLEPQIDSFSLYHYVREQHRSLVPALTAALSELTGNSAEVGL